VRDDVCGKHSAFGFIAGQEFHRAECPASGPNIRSK
jgi:hypothetical protein